MAKLMIEIDTCDKCQHSKSDRNYTSDSFEIEFDWSCKAHKSKTIAKSVNWGHETLELKVPNWCPFLVK